MSDKQEIKINEILPHCLFHKEWIQYYKHLDKNVQLILNKSFNIHRVAVFFAELLTVLIKLDHKDCHLHSVTVVRRKGGKKLVFILKFRKNDNFFLSWEDMELQI